MTYTVQVDPYADPFDFGIDDDPYRGRQHHPHMIRISLCQSRFSALRSKS